jgi:beta-glucanase (GH16 family)
VAAAAAIALGMVMPALAAPMFRPAATDSPRLIWADDFTRGGPPDPRHWTFESGFVRNEELQWYQPQNARCRGGMLVIEARRETKANPEYAAGSSDWRRRRRQAEYTSASLTTRHRHAWRFGRFELRARIDARGGLWPAFWTLGVDGEWPDSGEIDIMESYRGLLLANAAWGSGERWTPRWDDARVPIESLGGREWIRQFHVWRMEWTRERIVLSVDDRVLNEIDLRRTLNADGVNPFHQPHYLLLNLAVGGTNGGDPSQTRFPGRLEVDYVRVYEGSSS